jgi:hypothetical protein
MCRRWDTPEKRAIECDGRAHDLAVHSRAVVERGQDQIFQLVIERRDLACRHALLLPRIANRPAGDTLHMPLHPPAIQDTAAGHPVERGLHATGARGLLRLLRGIEPQVHPTAQQFAQEHIILLLRAVGI